MAHDIVYQMDFPDAREIIRIPLDPDSGGIITSPAPKPDWARLDHHQCEHCTLDPAQHEWCPIAANLADLTSGFQRRQSHDPVALSVMTPQRTYLVNTTLQRALGSLFGLISSLSDCPHTLPLRPMGRYHLPAASERETLLRTVSFFVLEQFLKQRDSRDKQIHLDELEGLYRRLDILNRHFARRLRAAASTDASINALTHLDFLVREVSFELRDQLKVLDQLFNRNQAANVQPGHDSRSSGG